MKTFSPVHWYPATQKCIWKNFALHIRHWHSTYSNLQIISNLHRNFIARVVFKTRMLAFQVVRTPAFASVHHNKRLSTSSRKIVAMATNFHDLSAKDIDGAILPHSIFAYSKLPTIKKHETMYYLFFLCSLSSAWFDVKRLTTALVLGLATLGTVETGAFFTTGPAIWFRWR